MITCPSCSSSRTLIHLDAARRGRCLRCGAGWVQEGGWQHSITRPAGHDRLRAVADIEVPTGMSGMDLALAVVGELQRAQGAEVTGHDVVGGVPGISLRMRVPLALRFEAQRERYSTVWIHSQELSTRLSAAREALQRLRLLNADNLRKTRLERDRLAAARELARRGVGAGAR